MNRIEQLEDDLIRLRSQVTKMRKEVVQEVTTAVSRSVSSTLGAVINFLRNGDLSWSENHYNDAAPPSGADDEKEAAHWYTHIATRSHSDYVVTNGSPNVSSATANFTTDDEGNYFQLSGGSTVPAGTTVLTRTDASNIVLSNNVTTTGTGRTGTIVKSKLVEDSAHAVSSTGHTVNNPAGAADPAWDRVNGGLQIGSNKSIDAPLPRKMAQPSKFMYVGFVARKRTAGISLPAGLKLRIGFHDNTSGQRKYLTGGQFTLSAAVVGAPAGTTSRNYKVVATTDWGETYESNEITVANAPNDASYITNQVYVRLDWTKVIGATIYRIYRLTGGVYVLAGEIFNGTPGFNEMNNYLKTEAGYPTTSGTNARAYVEIKFDDLTSDWQGYVACVPVPQTYNSSLTTDKQWLRLALSQALSAGNERGIEIDKIYVSWNFGNFAPAPEDSSAKQEIDTAATSGTQGSVGTAGGGTVPDPGEGGRCVWVEEVVQCYDAGTRRRHERAARDVTEDDLLVSIDEFGRPCIEEIAGILDGWTSRLYVITTENGCQIHCSPAHPIIQAMGDHHGLAAALLRKGHAVLTLTLAGERADETAVAAWEYMDGLFPVRMFQLKSGRHLFVAGGVVSHNIKAET